MLHIDLEPHLLKRTILSLVAWLVSEESRARETITELKLIKTTNEYGERTDYCLVNEPELNAWCQRLTDEYEIFGNAFESSAIGGQELHPEDLTPKWVLKTGAFRAVLSN